MTARRTAVALITAEHNTMDDEAKAIVSELGREQLELVTLALAGWAWVYMFNQACEEVGPDPDAAREWVDDELQEHGLASELDVA